MKGFGEGFWMKEFDVGFGKGFWCRVLFPSMGLTKNPPAALCVRPSSKSCGASHMETSKSSSRIKVFPVPGKTSI